MSHYLLSIYQPYGETMDQFPDAEFLEPIMREVDALKEDMRRQGVSVYEGGLHARTAATGRRARGDAAVATDGPFAQARGHRGGTSVIDVPALGAALHWGGRLARAGGPLAIEVRPFQEG